MLKIIIGISALILFLIIRLFKKRNYYLYKIKRRNKMTCECSKCGENIEFNKEDITLIKTIYSKNEIKEIYGVRCSNCRNYTYINEE